jgi:hypothetical protein
MEIIFLNTYSGGRHWSIESNPGETPRQGKENAYFIYAFKDSNQGKK